MKRSILSGLSTVVITLHLISGCGSAKQIGYLTRPEQPAESEPRLVVSFAELPMDWQYMDATIIYYHLQQQKLRPSRDYWLEVRYTGTDSIAMKAEYVVVSSPLGTDTMAVSVWERATTDYGIYDPGTDRTYRANLTLARVTVFGNEPIDTLNYSFDLSVVHFDTVATLEGPIHFEGQVVKYRY